MGQEDREGQNHRLYPSPRLRFRISHVLICWLDVEVVDLRGIQDGAELSR